MFKRLRKFDDLQQEAPLNSKVSPIPLGVLSLPWLYQNVGTCRPELQQQHAGFSFPQVFSNSAPELGHFQVFPRFGQFQQNVLSSLIQQQQMQKHGLLPQFLTPLAENIVHRSNLPHQPHFSSQPQPQEEDPEEKNEEQVEVPQETKPTRKRRSSEEAKKARETNKKAHSDSDHESDDQALLTGEHRLVIVFENYGTLGKHVQTFGKSGVIIPDGISGTHTVYSEPWRFQIRHGNEVLNQNKVQCVCLTWIVTHLETGVTHERTETPQEALIRASRGRTISNQIFKTALENRVKELSKCLDEETNEFRRASLQSRIRHLQPKRFSQGPLVFGLQHEKVQEIMRGLMDEKESSS